jgi:hypothetical protein
LLIDGKTQQTVFLLGLATDDTDQTDFLFF